MIESVSFILGRANHPIMLEAYPQRIYIHTGTKSGWHHFFSLNSYQANNLALSLRVGENIEFEDVENENRMTYLRNQQMLILKSKRPLDIPLSDYEALFLGDALLLLLKAYWGK
jgi:hypothetical protein